MEIYTERQTSILSPKLCTLPNHLFGYIPWLPWCGHVTEFTVLYVSSLVGVAGFSAQGSTKLE